ncbi:hypothetical protein M3Y97_00155500 [Aphelenchoides bicaudatus]|nr:hypothetical protein M3Y97_00155500 [Aphelenchoides bicaudatus]
MASLDFVDPQLDLQTTIEETNLKLEWVLKTLYDNNSDFKEILGNSKVTKLESTEISKGNGFCSRILKTCVHFDDLDKTYFFVMKVPTEEFIFKLIYTTVESPMERDKMLEEILTLHNIELAKIYYLQRAIDQQTGVIMMEDLSESTTVTGLFRSITPGMCLNFARHFADLQAHFELMDKSDWRERFTTNIYTRVDLVESEKKGLYAALNFRDGELHDQIHFFLDIEYNAFACLTVIDRAKEYGALMFCHGDAWVNNMLVKVKDGSISDEFAAFLDWQTVFVGSAMHDMARFLVNCADSGVRREIEEKAVDVYYDRLTENLKAHGREVKFTREQAHELYELAFVHSNHILVKAFAFLAMPLEKSGKPEDIAKTDMIWNRLKHAFEDSEPLIKKHDLRNRFAV